MTAETVEPHQFASTSEILLAWDQARPRSQQVELGMSELGGCRRRVGYRLAGTPPSNPGASVQAVMGTAIHDVVARILALMAPPEDLVEAEIKFAGILGHLDRYEARIKTLIDVKTTSSRWLEHIKVAGPERAHLWQTNGYAAALIRDGYPVEHIRIDYLARDTGEEWTWIGAPDPAIIREALAWVTMVRETPLDDLPRDYEPDGPFCKHCPFAATCWEGGVVDRDKRSVLFVEDPDIDRWANELAEARAQIKALETVADRAKGALDAVRPAGGGDITTPSGKVLRWIETTPRRLDGDAVKAEYAKAGATPPYKASKPTVTLKFIGSEQETPE